MIAFPHDYFLIGWFILAAASTAYVAYDQFKGNPEPTVMKWGFILVSLYMGHSGCCSMCWPTRSRGRVSTRLSQRRCGSRAAAALCWF